MTSNSASNKFKAFEISAVILTALGKFILVDYLHSRTVFILTAIVLWSFYLIYRGKRNPGILQYWGFRTDNFNKVAKTILPFGILCLILFIGIGLYQHTINLTWHIIPILILYPIWGIIQQFLVIALIVGNLQNDKSSNVKNGFIIFLSALLFGLIHYPYGWLILGSFMLAIFYGIIYLKERNLYALGIFHGWLGGLFFYTVVNRDPFIESFGRLMHIAKWDVPFIPHHEKE